MTPVLTAENLEKGYGPEPILRGVSFAIGEAERIGLLGRNGSGKSTLARIAAGLEQPDGGTLSRRRGAEVAFLEQEPALPPGASALEVVLGGLTRWNAAMQRFEALGEALASGQGDLDQLTTSQAEAAAEIERLGGWNQSHLAESVLGHLGVTAIHAPLGPQSGGEKRRVALARLLVSAPDLAILDEPTNHLDADAIEWLETHLTESFKGAVWLITHDRYVLDRVVTRTLELEHGTLHSYDGGYGAFLEQKGARLAQEARTEANRQNFLRTEIDWLRRMPKARTTKQKARIDRAEAAMAVRGPAAARTATLSMDAERLGKTIVDLEGVGIRVGGRPLFAGLDLCLTEGMRVGVVGKNGAGKTTLLRAILGTLDPAGPVEVTGRIVRGQNTKFTYLDQLRGGLDGDGTILDNVAGGQLRVELGGRVMDSRAYLERFLFAGAKQRQKVSTLSGGERARVALAKHLLIPANVLVLDEPTNDLDIETLGALEELLVEFPGCALLVSHDRAFLDRVATDILAFEGDGRVIHQPGGYSTYRALRDERIEAARESGGRAAAEASPPRASQPAAKPAATGTAGPAGPATPAAKPLTYAERLELDGLLDKVTEAESRLSAAEAALNDPDLYAGTSSATRAAAAQTEFEAAKAELARLTARWEELEARREASPRK